MEGEFSIPQDKKEEVRGFVDEIDELLEFATEALEKGDREDALEKIISTSTAAEQLDEIFIDAEGYEEIKDYWRAGVQAANEGEIQEGIETIRQYLESLR